MPEPQPVQKRKRRWGFVAVALLAGLGLALLAAEVAVRLLWKMPAQFAEFDNAGLYAATADGDVALQPGYSGTLKIGDATLTHVDINSLGLRGPECEVRSAGQRRVLLVGDSLVFGYGVEAEQALPHQTELALRDAGVNAVCGNAGVPSYGSRHAAAQMARLDRPFGADAFVVCSFLGNDAIDDVSPQRTVYAGIMLQGVMARLVHTSWRTRLALRSRAALWCECWIIANKPEWSPLFATAPTPEEALGSAGFPPTAQQHAGLFLDVIDANQTWVAGAPPVVPRVLATLRAALQRDKQTAGARPLVYVVLPTVWQVSEEKRVAELGKLGLDAKLYQRGLAQQRWLGVAQELGITALDATSVLAAQPDAAAMFFDGGHLSVQGNRIVARWLAETLAPLLH